MSESIFTINLLYPHLDILLVGKNLSLALGVTGFLIRQNEILIPSIGWVTLSMSLNLSELEQGKEDTFFGGFVEGFGEK